MIEWQPEAYDADSDPVLCTARVDGDVISCTPGAFEISWPEDYGLKDELQAYLDQYALECELGWYAPLYLMGDSEGAWSSYLVLSAGAMYYLKCDVPGTVNPKDDVPTNLASASFVVPVPPSPLAAVLPCALGLNHLGLAELEARVTALEEGGDTPVANKPKFVDYGLTVKDGSTAFVNLVLPFKADGEAYDGETLSFSDGYSVNEEISRACFLEIETEPYEAISPTTGTSITESKVRLEQLVAFGLWANDEPAITTHAMLPLQLGTVTYNHYGYVGYEVAITDPETDEWLEYSTTGEGSLDMSVLCDISNKVSVTGASKVYLMISGRGVAPLLATARWPAFYTQQVSLDLLHAEDVSFTAYAVASDPEQAAAIKAALETAFASDVTIALEPSAYHVLPAKAGSCYYTADGLLPELIYDQQYR